MFTILYIENQIRDLLAEDIFNDVSSLVEELSDRLSNPDSAKDNEFLAELKSVSTIWCESSLFKMDFGSNIYGQF
jgi:hypothetical protein